jgi:hypothetical protein
MHLESVEGAGNRRRARETRTGRTGRLLHSNQVPVRAQRSKHVGRRHLSGGMRRHISFGSIVVLRLCPGAGWATAGW